MGSWPFICSSLFLTLFPNTIVLRLLGTDMLMPLKHRESNNWSLTHSPNVLSHANSDKTTKPPVFNSTWPFVLERIVKKLALCENGLQSN